MLNLLTEDPNPVWNPLFDGICSQPTKKLFGMVWFNRAFLRLKSRNNTNAARGNTITSNITSWLYGDEKIQKIRNFMFRSLEIMF